MDSPEKVAVTMPLLLQGCCVIARDTVCALAPSDREHTKTRDRRCFITSVFVNDAVVDIDAGGTADVRTLAEYLSNKKSAVSCAFPVNIISVKVWAL